MVVLNVGGSQNSNAPGLDPYSLTKIEYLALKCQAYHNVGMGDIWEDRFSISFVAKDSNTISLFAIYRQGVDLQKLNLAIALAQEAVEMEAYQKKGWRWVQIKKEYVKSG
jgi:hypothetical protein